MPTIYDMTKVCRFSEEVVVFLRTYKSFAPQQFVPFEAIISNEKNVTITKIVVKLIQVSKSDFNEYLCVPLLYIRNFYVSRNWSITSPQGIIMQKKLFVRASTLILKM